MSVLKSYRSLLRFRLPELAAILVACQSVALAQVGAVEFQNPPEGPTYEGRELHLSLQVGYAYASVYNPAISGSNVLHLRLYNGALVGPTIRVRPGDKMVIRLSNALPGEQMAEHAAGDVNVPHGFDVTNLHTHGLHVSPQGNGDNVFLSIPPGSTFEYDIDVPKDHPTGTFWYHAHKHGSTALQVSSGMSGALIVEGTGAADLNSIKPEDIGRILLDPTGARWLDRIWVFQQIPYSCNGSLSLQDCKADAIGEVEDYGARFGPNSWENSGHFTSVNGLIHPILHSKTGSIERWRLIHAGVRETLQVKIAECDLVARPGVSIAALAAAIPSLDASRTVAQWEIAADGVTRNDVYQKRINVLQPGYRSDVLVRFAHPGTYCVFDEADPNGPMTKSTVDAELESRKLLAVVVAEGGDAAESTEQLIGSALAGNNTNLPPPVLQDLRKLHTAAFAPLNDIRGNTVDGRQNVTFSVDVSKNPNVFQVDGQRYDPTRIDRTLKLNHLDEWTLTSSFGSHPFHIHTNPFEIVSIKNSQGVSLTDANCLAADAGDPQYCGMIGTWKDTIFVKQDHVITIRTRYTDYVGDFVLHCHILDHEDQGMMQNVRIIP